MQHDYFGALLVNLETNTKNPTNSRAVDVYYEKNIPLTKPINAADFDLDLSVEAWVWASAIADLTPVVLLQFENLCKQLEVLDDKARHALTHYLEQDRSYIDCYLDIDDRPAFAPKIEPSVQIIAAQFVEEMRLEGVGLWATEFDTENSHSMDKSPLILDYMINADISDQILAVRMSITGDVIDIVWES